MRTRVVILGAGFGGLELSSRLSAELAGEVDITLIDQGDSFIFGFSKLDVMFARRTMDEVRIPYRDITKPDVTFRQEPVLSIDPECKRVVTNAGAYDADVLVVALGADLAPGAAPGLDECGYEFHSPDGAPRVRDLLPAFPGGNVVIAVLGGFFKCPPAPCETASMLHDYLSRREVRDAATFHLVTPMPKPIPISDETSAAIIGLLDERGIRHSHRSWITRLDPATKVAHLKDGQELPFDLFLAVPVHRAPPVVMDSGLTENGWIPVDPAPFATKFPDVYAVGDITSAPVSRAGVIAEGEASTAAEVPIAAVDDKVHELYRSPAPRALIGTLDRLMGDPGSAERPAPGSTAATGLGGLSGRRQARGRPVSRSTVPALAGPVPVGPGPAADLSGAQGLAREPSPGGGRPGEARLARPRLLDDGVPSGGRCRLLGIFAHPDDETFCAGGTFARYAGQGAEIMVVSATRGQAGQIRDAAAGNRRTIAAVREAELRLACERLGITKVRCLDHVDGTLADAEFPALVDEVAEVICEFRPDVVITFAPDGGYGHPDHVTISAVTTAACQRAAGPGHRPGRTVTRPLRRPPRLYYRHFPPGDLLIMEHLATWLTSQPDRFAGTPAFAHALLLLAEAARTMRHIRDHVQVRWYPPGSYVVEQGEVAAELFLILSGEAELWKESNGGRRERLGRLGVGEFFGHRHRSADVVAAASLTCLVLSPAPPAKFAGRGPGARLAGALPGARADASPAAANVRAGQGVVCCDVSGQVMRKVEALSAYRSQFPLEPDMFPEFLLQEIFGCEYFVACRPARSSGRGARA